MRGYSEAVKADVRRRMSPPHRQSVARISEELGIHVITLYKWRKTWRLQGEVVPASEKEPNGWSAADKFTVVLETAGLNATELSAYCRERGLFPEQVERWRQAAQDANAKPVLTMAEQKELEKLRAQDQREIKALKRSCSARRRPWRRWRPCWCCEKVGGLLLGGRGRLTSTAHRREAIELIGEANAAGARLVSACAEIGISLRTLRRWRKAFGGDGDGEDRRKGSSRLVGHRLSEEERQRILLTCNQPEYASLPPGQIVPALADQGLYIGSESSFYRVLHQAGVPPTGPGPPAAGTAIGAAPGGGSPQCALVVGHHLSAHDGARRVALPLSGG